MTDELVTASNKRSYRRSLSSTLKRLIILIIFVIILSFLVSTYLITDKERRDFKKRESENVLTILSQNIRSDIQNYSELSRIIMTDDRLVNFLRAEESTVDMGMINDARYGVMDILNVKEGVDTVFIFREDLIMLSTKRYSYKFDHDRIEGNEWREDIYNAKGRAVVSLNSNGVAVTPDNKPVVTIGRAIYDLFSQKRTGILLLNISPAVFERMLGQLKYDNICIMGQDGSFLAGNEDYVRFFDESFLSPRVSHKDVMEGGEQYLLSGCKVNNMPIVILRVTPYGIEGIPYSILYVLAIMMAVLMIMVILVGRFITQNITKPVYKLSASMEDNKQSGDLKKIELDIPYSELDMLKGDYNDLIDHVNELIETVIDKEKTVQRAEMRVLQEQIKPHFLYNSIETIGFLAMDAGADKVHDALETLGSFYRNFLSKGDREIRLSQEIRIVQDYLSLQKLRYGDIINDEYDIAEDAGNFIVPKLILQPLVENSIYHGIRLKGEPGLIRISARISEDVLLLTVHDTGVGMDEKQIARILSPDRKKDDDSDTGSFGLWGTIERIRIYCNRDDVVDIVSEAGEYTEIRLKIPRGGL